MFYFGAKMSSYLLFDFMCKVQLRAAMHGIKRIQTNVLRAQNIIFKQL